RQAQHRRHRPLPRPFADEAGDVAVVGPEVVPPLRQAVGLVKHPRADLALGDDPSEGTVAQLLGDTIKMATSPRRTRSSTSWRSGIDNRPFSAAHDEMPRPSRPATWSAISATSGE